jgi:hypothetical protein
VGKEIIERPFDEIQQQFLMGLSTDSYRENVYPSAATLFEDTLE